MAGVQWTGENAKAKTKQAVKALFRHNDKDERRKHEHSNPHIGCSSDEHNFNYRGLDYRGMCEAFDRRLAELDVGRESSGKNARTIMQSLIVYCPEGITDDLQKVEWFRAVGDLLAERYGKNLIEFSVHFDEVHEYVDPETKEKVESRVHGHADITPEVEGQLNGKKFATRKEINALNRAIDEMTRTKYKVPYMTGQGKNKGGNRPMGKLKAESAQAEAEALWQEGFDAGFQMGYEAAMKELSEVKEEPKKEEAKEKPEDRRKSFIEGLREDMRKADARTHQEARTRSQEAIKPEGRVIRPETPPKPPEATERPERSVPERSVPERSVPEWMVEMTRLSDRQQDGPDNQYGD